MVNREKLSFVDDLTIKALREGLGMSQSQFAEVLSVTKTTVKNWESGICYPTKEKAMHLLSIAVQLLTAMQGDRKSYGFLYVADLCQDARQLIQMIAATHRKILPGGILGRP